MKHTLQKIMTWLMSFKKYKNITHAKKNKITKKHNATSKKPDNYFSQATHWSDDLYATTIASRNRWRAVSLYGLTPAIFLLLMSITLLIPTQHLAPLLINHWPDGQVTVVPLKQPHPPKSGAQVQSDIVRYVINRESYSAYSYQYQYQLVTLLSDNSVATQYIKTQQSSNPHAPINVLGDKGSRQVHVTSVLFLDTATDNQPNHGIDHHHNLAEVNFTITNHKANGLTNTVPLTALIAWTYRGTPANPADAWKNWDGFSVTHYQVQQRNLKE